MLSLGCIGIGGINKSDWELVSLIPQGETGQDNTVKGEQVFSDYYSEQEIASYKDSDQKIVHFVSLAGGTIRKLSEYCSEKASPKIVKQETEHSIIDDYVDTDLEIPSYVDPEN